MPLKLPRFEYSVPLVEEDNRPTLTFHRWWQSVADALESAFNDLETAVIDIQTAQATADATAREAARLASYTDPTNALTSTDLGGATGARITVATHERIYPVQGTIDVPDVSVTGAIVTGEPFAYTTQYSVYYDDPGLTGGVVTYTAVPTASQHATAQPGAAAGRHFVGVVTTPASGGGGTTGVGGFPPGGGGGEFIP